MWRPSIPKVTPVKCKHTCLCAININVKESINLLIMCSYMPYDNRRRDANFEEFVDVLQELKSFIYDSNPDCGVWR